MHLNTVDSQYEEQYYQTSNYKSAIDKYTSYNNFAQSSNQINNGNREGFRLGENLQTQHSRHNAEDSQNFDYTRNTVNNLYNSNSPDRKSEEEYRVQYDP